MTEEPDRYKDFTTEQPHPASEDLDLLSPREFLALMQSEDRLVLEALGKVEKELAQLIEELANRFKRGGRLYYVGAGTSGRLGALDAAECPPTFGASPEMVQTILAGGYECLVRSVEGAEDNRSNGEAAISERRIASEDFVLGIAASSSTPFVRGALSEARRVGAYTVLLTLQRKHSHGVSLRSNDRPRDRSGDPDRFNPIESRNGYQDVPKSAHHGCHGQDRQGIQESDGRPISHL